MEKMLEVLTRLIERSGEGKLEWRETPVRNVFKATLGDISVTLKIEGIPDLYEYEIRVIDKKGRDVEVLRSGDLKRSDDLRLGGGTGKKMEDLYELARRSAYNTDSTLDELVHQLDAIR